MLGKLLVMFRSRKFDFLGVFVKKHLKDIDLKLTVKRLNECVKIFHPSKIN